MNISRKGGYPSLGNQRSFPGQGVILGRVLRRVSCSHKKEWTDQSIRHKEFGVVRELPSSVVNLH